MSARTKWTKQNVEHLWTIMTALQNTRERSRMNSWWSLVAQQLNDVAGVNVTARACANKATEVRQAGRPYPWEETVSTGDHTYEALINLTEKLDAIDKKLDRLLATKQG